MIRRAVLMLCLCIRVYIRLVREYLPRLVLEDCVVFRGILGGWDAERGLSKSWQADLQDNDVRSDGILVPQLLFTDVTVLLLFFASTWFKRIVSIYSTRSAQGRFKEPHPDGLLLSLLSVETLFGQLAVIPSWSFGPSQTERKLTRINRGTSRWLWYNKSQVAWGLCQGLWKTLLKGKLPSALSNTISLSLNEKRSSYVYFPLENVIPRGSTVLSTNGFQFHSISLHKIKSSRQCLL